MPDRDSHVPILLVPTALLLLAVIPHHLVDTCDRPIGEAIPPSPVFTALPAAWTPTADRSFAAAGAHLVRMDLPAMPVRKRRFAGLSCRLAPSAAAAATTSEGWTTRSPANTP